MSLIWLYSILLIFSIDLLEFIIVGDPYVHSRLSIVVVMITMCFLITLCIRYFDLNHLKDPHFYRGMFGLAFTIVLLVLILITRMWASSHEKALAKTTLNSNSNPNNKKNMGENMTRLYMRLYQIVLLMLGSVQIYENARAHMARIFTNMAYVLWLGACALQVFYLSTLPTTRK